ncbi:hypothetical protein THRCLA_03521 [Thraustotheca clavata]|uniref:Transmembrane protein n=1 Tax=Thraustotheca clavata TaxID=74557 RepID=A0A1W0A1V1_9STRA|nr:hypothetical protein THRCLA_03521 [Thraustotheca clavata]
MVRIEPSITEVYRYQVRYNKRSIITSLFMSLNIALMPMKAYISEDFPWTPETRLDLSDLCTMNRTQCHELLLSVGKQQSHTVLTESDYNFSPNGDVSVGQVSIKNNSDLGDFLASMPTSQYYSKMVHEKALALGAGKLNASDFHAITIVKLFGMPLAYSVYWATPSLEPEKLNIYVALQLPQFSLTFKILKWGYRLLMCSYLIFAEFRYYYRYYPRLVQNLRLHGICSHKGAYEILVGDPTSIILLNPYVALAFFIDYIFSVDYVCRSIVRVCQVKDITVFILTTIYLSRTVWFAYGALCLTSYILRKLDRINFQPVDPTITALLVSFLAGPITYLQSRWRACIDLYYFFLTQTLPVAPDETECTLATIIYVLTIALLPIYYGLIASKLFSLKPKKLDVKSILFLNLATSSFRLSQKSHLLQGGSCYDAFQIRPQWKKFRSMNQMGADAHVIFKRSDGIEVRVRLTLITCVNMPIVGPSTSRNAVGHCDPIAGVIVQGDRSSPWIM